MMVEQVPKPGDDTRGGGRIVVGAEERDQLVLVCERGSDPAERVGVDLDVASTKTSTSPFASRAPAFRAAARTGPGRLAYDEELLGGGVGTANRRRERPRRWVVRCRRESRSGSALSRS